MQIIIVSDSHTHDDRLKTILTLYPHADLYLHCGDAESNALPQFITIQGNNDWTYDFDEEKVITVPNHKIFMTHSHRFPFHSRLQTMADKAKTLGCDIVCYGHTHIAAIDHIDNILLVNPGSLWKSRDGKAPSYAVMTIDSQGNIHTEIKYYQK